MDKEDIKLERGFLGLTQQEFSRLTGYSFNYIKNVEAGNSPVNLRLHTKLAEVVHSAIYDARLEQLGVLKNELKRYLK